MPDLWPDHADSKVAQPIDTKAINSRGLLAPSVEFPTGGFGSVASALAVKVTGYARQAFATAPRD